MVGAINLAENLLSTMDNEHFDRMGESRLKLEFEFNHHFIPNTRYVPSDHSFFRLLSTRFSQPGSPVLRGYFFDLIANYIREESGKALTISAEEITVLMLSSEVLMSVFYYDNQILDRKGGVVSPKSVNDNLIESNLLLSELLSYVNTRLKNDDFRIALLNTILDVYAVVNMGQRVEAQENYYHNWEEGKYELVNRHKCMIDQEVIDEVYAIIAEKVDVGTNKEAFICYLKRIYLTNAYLFISFSDVLIKFSNLDDEKTESVYKFCSLAGIMYQIVNDVTDFVPSTQNSGTKTKLNSDSYADLKRGILTLPIMFQLILKPSGLFMQYLGQIDANLSLLEEYCLTKEMLESKAIEYSKEVGIDTKRLALSNLNDGNHFYKHFKDMVSVANGNRNYTKLKLKK
jgi:geranylgeranyl pyrophosphate synthase